MPSCCEAPGWRPDVPATETAALLLDCLDRGGTFVGVFDAEALVGVSEPDDIHLVHPL